MIVVDASAIVEVVAHRRIETLAKRLSNGDLHAPHLIDVEVTHALRGLVHRREIEVRDATGARADVADISMTLYPHALLLDRAWALRNSLSAYDAVYVALAELLPAPLVTCDALLAASSGHDAEIELYALPS